MKAELPYWPAALRLDHAAAYCGLSVPTFTAVCPVKPIQFTQSGRGRRWLRARLGAWLGTPDTNDPETGSGRRTFGDVIKAAPEPGRRRHRRRGQVDLTAPDALEE